MKILAIETSCDETAVSLVEAEGGLAEPRFTVLAQLVSSQTAIHAPWGGVVPNLAKREHQKNLVPLLLEALPKADRRPLELTINQAGELKSILEREPELLEHVMAALLQLGAPDIDAIAVTHGPGLEPALWVGLNFARALAMLWHKPLVATNHMEGHIASALAEGAVKLPAVALLVSGGHTELVLVKKWGEYQLVGQTLDDAVGEAFDKVARLLGLPYPGGPEISKLAETNRRDWPPQRGPKEQDSSPPVVLPRPMLHSHDFNFSFSGLKTAVLYLIKKLEPLTTRQKAELACEFQQAVIDVLVAKSLAAVREFKPKALIAGGGVIANRELRAQLAAALKAAAPRVRLAIPPFALATDNATMIAMAAYLKMHYQPEPAALAPLRAQGNLRLD